MITTTEIKKAALLKKASVLAEGLLDPAERTSAKRFIAEFYAHVPPADVAERSPRNLYGAALELWHLGERRRPRQAKVRVHNPDPMADGWSSPHTIVEIVNDDMPFLVDSVTGAINASNRVVHLIIHPILTVARGEDGQLFDVLDPGAAGCRESWMQIEITPEHDATALAQLTRTLSAVLADVRMAVDDWQPMRTVLREMVDSLSGQASPVPHAELNEVQDFLCWLDDDNFTFLGFREYVFNGVAKPEYEPLGVLRDETHPIFGGLRDLSSLPSDVQDFVRRRELLVVTKSNRRSTVHRTAHMDAIGVRRFGPSGDVVGVRVLLGLFTSLAYSRDPRSIPLLRLKVRRIVERSGFSPTSHDGKALLHILDTFPRDELFQTDEDQLFDTAAGILNLQSASGLRYSSAATRWSGSSPASSMCRATAMTASCAAVSRKYSKRRTPAGYRPSIRISMNRRWRVSISSFARPEVQFQRSISQPWSRDWQMPDVVGWTGSRRLPRRPLAATKRV